MKHMYDKLMENIEKITKFVASSNRRNILDCSEVSLEKDPTLKNILNKYEQEIKIYVRVQKELKESIKSQDIKIKEKDEEIRELRELLDVSSWLDQSLKSLKSEHCKSETLS